MNLMPGTTIHFLFGSMGQLEFRCGIVVNAADQSALVDQGRERETESERERESENERNCG